MKRLVRTRMRKISTHLGSRLVWCLLGLGLGAIKIVDGLQLHQTDQAISGLGFLFFGTAWFMQPLVPGLQSSDENQRATIGSTWLRTCLIFTGFACLSISLLLKYVVSHIG